MLLHGAFALAATSDSTIEQKIEQSYQLWKSNDLEMATKLLEEADQALDGVPNPRLKAKLITVRCRVLFSQGNFTEAKINNELGFNLPGLEQFPEEKAKLMLCHAKILDRLSDSGAAIALLEEVYQYATQHNLAKQKASSLFIRGQYLADLGNAGEALKLLNEANNIFRSINDVGYMSDAMSAIANILYYEKNYEKANEYNRELLKLTADDPFQQSSILYNLGDSYLALNELNQAQSYFLKSIEQSQLIDDIPGIGYAKLGLAKVFLSRKNYQKSLDFLEQALDIFNSLNMQNQVAQVKAQMAHNYAAQKQYATAEKLYQAALSQYKTAEIKPGIQSMSRTLADIYAKQNNYQKAYQYFLAYNKLFTEQVNNNKEQALAEMQVLFDTEKKEFENKYLTRELRLQTDMNEQAKQQDRLKTALLITFAVTIILMAFLIRKHIRHKEMFRRLSQTDELTQINNRRQILSIAENCFELFKRYQTPVTLLMFDIDHFKQFNDLHGHDTGDKVLKTVADTATAALRKTDRIGRFGGEEFLIVLTNTHQAVASEVAERLRIAVEAIAKENDAFKMPITISIGGCEMQSQFGALDDLIKKADEALYTAKAGGRNCVRLV